MDTTNKKAVISKNKSQKIDPTLIVKNMDLGLLLTVFISILIVTLAGMISPYTPNIIDIFRGKTELKQPDLQRSDFEKRDELIESQIIKYDKKVTLLKEPIVTPPYYTNSDRLKNYLISKSVSIGIKGTIEDAYLYIKTGTLNLENESVSFYIVDGNSIAGHLFAPKSVFSRGDNEFVYNLKELPLVKLPYSIKNDPDIENVVEKVLNHASVVKENLYMGALVSTTTLPNQVEQMEIRYTCVNRGDCEIRVLE